MIGKSISHYKILENLGSGGMGDVYKAEDTNLKRTVALKFLPHHLTRNEDAKGRFLHEAQAASALDHQNIGAIYEIDETDDGQMFIAMAYYAGETLKDRIESGPVPLDEAIKISIQIAEGLARAHARNIIHRDIKPANIALSEENEIKIIDFGLAKLAGQTMLTQAGMTLGTVSYMSPEQARGDLVDHRTDIWALGVLIYELVIGHLPFRSAYEQALIYSILNEEPEPVTSLRQDIPPFFGDIICKALTKEADERYQDMNEMIADLKSLTMGETTIHAKKRPIKRSLIYGGISVILTLLGASWISYLPDADEKYVQASIAVLPFKDMSQDQDQEYFCDGMTEEILTKLAKFGNLKVIAKSSAARFRNTDKSIKDIGHALGVSTIMEGSIRRENDIIRVTAQLINVEDESHLWAENYNKKLSSVFELQEEVSKSIAQALKIQFADESEVEYSSVRPGNVEAYEYYLKGMYQLNRRYVISEQESSFNKALVMFNKSIQIDSTYAMAYVGRGIAYIQKYDASAYQDRQAFSQAEENYAQALALDPGSADAHTGMGIIYSIKRDYDNAYQSLKTSMKYNPNNTETNFVAAMFLRSRGLFQRSIELFSKAKELDPFRVSAYVNLAQDLIYTGKFKEAYIVVEKAKEIEPDFVPIHGMEVQLALINKDFTRAARIISEADKIHPGRIALEKALFLAATGERAGALALSDHPVFYMVAGEVYAQLGMKDEAINAITDAINQDRSHYYYINLINNPLLENLTDDPRFQNIIEEQKEKNTEYQKKYVI